MKTYAALGNREIGEMRYNFGEIAGSLAKKEYTLRTNGTLGTSQAFIDGAGIRKEIFLPWWKFNGLTYNSPAIPREAYHIAEICWEPEIVKNGEVIATADWPRLKRPTKKIMASNVLALLGEKLNSPVKFLITYYEGEADGSTIHVAKIAKKYDIPIYNLANLEDLKKINKLK